MPTWNSPAISRRSMVLIGATCSASRTWGASRVKAAIASPMREAGLVAVLSKMPTCSSPPRRWWMSSTLARKASVAASRRRVSACTRSPSGVSAKPERPRRHSDRPRRSSRSLMWRLMVDTPMFSSSSAAAMPPQSATHLNTRSRRRSMSPSWPSRARFFAFINRQVNSDNKAFIRVTEKVRIGVSLHRQRNCHGSERCPQAEPRPPHGCPVA